MRILIVFIARWFAFSDLLWEKSSKNTEKSECDGSVSIKFNSTEACIKHSLIKWVDFYVYTSGYETFWYHTYRYALYTEHLNGFQWNFVYCFTPLNWTASKGLYEWRAIVRCKILESQWFRWNERELVEFLRENIWTILYKFHCGFLKIAWPFKFLNNFFYKCLNNYSWTHSSIFSFRK